MEKKKINYNDKTIFIPDYYEEAELSPEAPEGIIAFTTDTEHAYCVVQISQEDYSKSLPRVQKDLLEGIRMYLGENQGIVKVEVGDDYVYAIVKNLKEPRGLVYFLTYQKFCDDGIIDVRGQFEEIGMTGMRESVVVSQCMSEKLISLKDGRMEGWAKDPYDENVTTGALMNLSEDEKYDEQFPDFPLSMCREFVNCLVE